MEKDESQGGKIEGKNRLERWRIPVYFFGIGQGLRYYIK
jgi:hypothetical protein